MPTWAKNGDRAHQGIDTKRRRRRFCSRLTKARWARKISGITWCEQKIDASTLRCQRSSMRLDFALEEFDILDYSREILFEIRPSHKASIIHRGVLTYLVNEANLMFASTCVPIKHDKFSLRSNSKLVDNSLLSCARWTSLCLFSAVK